MDHDAAVVHDEFFQQGAAVLFAFSLGHLVNHALVLGVGGDGGEIGQVLGILLLGGGIGKTQQPIDGLGRPQAAARDRSPPACHQIPRD